MIRQRLAAAMVAVLLLLAGCTPGPADAGRSPVTPASTLAPTRVSTLRPSQSPAPSEVATPFQDPLPGMPPVIGNNVYSQTQAGMVDPRIADDPAYLYVPDSTGAKVTVVDQRTRKIVRVITAGRLSQHVVPSYDLTTLITNSSADNSLVLIDPGTGKKTRKLSVPRPYNLYFTPDGKQAVVMIEQHNTIRFADPHTLTKIADIQLPECKGPNHADFSGNGRFMVITCEFSGYLLKVSTQDHKILGKLKLSPKATAHRATRGMGMSMPQDVRLSPDGTIFYVADMGTNEVRMISSATFRQIGSLGMPKHPHGLYPSRDGKRMYISDRGAGQVSVLSFASRTIIAVWTIPGGGSPDMGGVSADGSMLWLSGRYDGVVYGFNTRTGKLVAKIHVGGSPHGLAVWPQPGRYSMGHTGNMR